MNYVVTVMLISLFMPQASICMNTTYNAQATQKLHNAFGKDAAGNATVNVKLLKEAIAENADINKAMQINEIEIATPLARAAYLGSPEAVEELIKAKADVNSLDNGFLLPRTGLLKQSVLAHGMPAMGEKPQESVLKSLKLLLDNGAQVNQEFPTGFTPLILAVKGGHLEVVKLLLSYGAKPEQKNKDGKSAFDFKMNKTFPSSSDKALNKAIQEELAKNYQPRSALNKALNSTAENQQATAHEQAQAENKAQGEVKAMRSGTVGAEVD